MHDATTGKCRRSSTHCRLSSRCSERGRGQRTGHAWRRWTGRGVVDRRGRAWTGVDTCWSECGWLYAESVSKRGCRIVHRAASALVYSLRSESAQYTLSTAHYEPLPAASNQSTRLAPRRYQHDTTRHGTAQQRHTHTHTPSSALSAPGAGPCLVLCSHFQTHSPAAACWQSRRVPVL